MAKAQLSWSLDVDCPHCGADIDLATGDYDCDHYIAINVFNNTWGKLKGYEVTCAECDKEFVLGEIEY